MTVPRFLILLLVLLIGLFSLSLWVETRGKSAKNPTQSSLATWLEKLAPQKKFTLERLQPAPATGGKLTVKNGTNSLTITVFAAPGADSPETLTLTFPSDAPADWTAVWKPAPPTADEDVRLSSDESTVMDSRRRADLLRENKPLVKKIPISRSGGRLTLTRPSSAKGDYTLLLK